jgi:general secretion pathway protein G
MEKRLNSVMRARHSGQKGFTLIELLVVIAVLAVLAGIVIFNVTGVTNRGAASACSTDTKSVQTAVDSYISDNPGSGAYAAAGKVVVGVLVPTYLHTPPGACKNGFAIDANNTVTGS